MCHRGDAAAACAHGATACHLRAACPLWDALARERALLEPRPSRPLLSSASRPPRRAAACGALARKRARARIWGAASDARTRTSCRRRAEGRRPADAHVCGRARADEQHRTRRPAAAQLLPQSGELVRSVVCVRLLWLWFHCFRFRQRTSFKEKDTGSKTPGEPGHKYGKKSPGEPIHRVSRGSCRKDLTKILRT